MTYELFKQLKEAGFRQNHSVAWGRYFITATSIGTREEISRLRDGDSGLISPHEFIYIPTLSELIEACGEDFINVGRTYNIPLGRSNSWEAVQKTLCCEEHGESRAYGYGQTPEEAVAKLWLELNK